MSSKGPSSKGEKRRKKDPSKFKCYGYHKFGHYVSNYSLRKTKGKKQVVASADADEVSSKMKKDLTFIACLTSLTS